MATREEALKIIADIFHFILKEVPDPANSKLLPGELGINYNTGALYIKHPTTGVVFSPNSLEDIVTIMSRYNKDTNEFNADLWGDYKIYTSIESLELTKGSETISSIITVMKNKSILIAEIDEFNNLLEYPVENGGILKITRVNETLISLEFFTRDNKRWIGFYDTTLQIPFSNWSANSGGGGGGGGIPRDNRVILTEDATEVLVGISEYNPLTDTLFVVSNGSSNLALNHEYHITGKGAETKIVKNTSGVWPKGLIFDFRALVSGILEDTSIFTPGILTSTYTAATDGEMTIPIGIEIYNDLTDHIEAFWIPWNQPLLKNINFTVSPDWKFINLIDFSVKTGEKILIKVQKKIRTDYNISDGATLAEKSVNLSKLTQDVQDEINKISPHILDYNQLLSRVDILDNDVISPLVNQDLLLSNADNIKSITTNVGSVPKVRIVAPDIRNNLFGRDGYGDSITNWVGNLRATNGEYIYNTGETGGTGGLGYNKARLESNSYYLISLVGKTQSETGPAAFFIQKGDGSAYYNFAAFYGQANPIRRGHKFSTGTITENLNIWPYANAAKPLYFKHVMIQKITTDEYNNLTVDQLLAKYPYVNGVQPLMHPCLTVRGKNLVDEKKIVAVGSYIKPTWTGEKLLFDNSSNTANRALTRFPVFLEKDKTYKPSRLNEIIINGSTVTFAVLDREGKAISNIYGTYIATYSGLHYLETFTAVGSLQKIELNIQLEEGIVATAYEPYREKQRIYPCTLAKVGDYADELEDDGVKIRKIGKVKKAILGGGLNWSFGSKVLTGVVAVKVNDFFNDNRASNDQNIIAVKYDGKIIFPVPLGVPWASGDQVYNSSVSKSVDISISSSDSGWGDNYTPTVAEIKAYFNGWKMNNGTFGTPYNGTGTKTWAAWNATSNTGAVTTAPTTMADGFTPYQLWYVLAQEEKEIIEPIGSLKLEQGYNCIDVSTGIVYERANIVFNGENTYHCNIIYGGYVSPQSKKVKKIISIFKNGIIDNSWSITATNAYGLERASCPIEKFDPTATYTIKYEALHEDYNSQQVQTELEYADNLRTSHNELVEIVAKQEDEINDLLYDLYYEKLKTDVHLADTTSAHGIDAINAKLTKNAIAFTPAAGLTVIASECYVENKRLYVSLGIKKTDGTVFAKTNRTTLGNFAGISFTRWLETMCPAYNNDNYASGYFSLKAGSIGGNTLYAENLSGTDITILAASGVFFIN